MRIDSSKPSLVYLQADKQDLPCAEPSPASANVPQTVRRCTGRRAALPQDDAARAESVHIQTTLAYRYRNSPETESSDITKSFGLDLLLDAAVELENEALAARRLTETEARLANAETMLAATLEAVRTAKCDQHNAENALADIHAATIAIIEAGRVVLAHERAATCLAVQVRQEAYAATEVTRRTIELQMRYLNEERERHAISKKPRYN